LAALRAKGEGAHFIVAQGGSVYQVLDLSLSPRRDGAYQPGEIRILSGELKGHKKLIGAIHDVFPNLKVSKVAAEPPKRQPKKTAHDKARAPEKHTDDEVHKTPKPASKTDHHDDEHHP
jgi:hypothetical protein